VRRLAGILLLLGRGRFRGAGGGRHDALGQAAEAGSSYSKTLTKPGTYKLICTFHEEDDMRMTIVVRHLAWWRAGRGRRLASPARRHVR